MFKPGSIRKIQVENFVTYTYAEMYPGPNLNMLIGPNGTGKSTMVAAIILGLGGKPKTVGRGSKISEYIKHGQTSSVINIFLVGQNDNDVIKMTRQFGLDSKSTWKRNDTKVSESAFLDSVAAFNIQVDNLCQFLPQDRVQHFAKLDKRELLKQTQIAICRDDLLEKQTQLINGRDAHKTLLAELEGWNQKLAEANDTVLRLQGVVKNFRKKKKFQEKVADIERKVAWMMYDVLKEKLDEVARAKGKAEGEVRKKKAEKAQLQQAVNNARKTMEKMMGQIASLGNQVRAAESVVRMKIEESVNLKSSIEGLLRQKENSLREVAQQAAEIETAVQELQRVENEQRAVLENVANEQQLDCNQEKYHSEIKKLQHHIRALQSAITELTDKRNNKLAEMRYHKNEKARLENVKQQRLERLRSTNSDAYKAVNWLRSNKNLFKEEVYEPMMLEINVLNADHSVYLENVIARGDKVAFTCTNKDDMAVLIKELRGKQRLKVNVLHSSRDGPRNGEFLPTLPIEQLRRYGFFTYLSSLFTAPDPIMKYLCQMYRVHQIPIGTEVTNRMFKDVPRSVPVFFSNDSRYSTTYSKYTGEKSIRQNEVRSDGTLSITVDALRLQQIEGQMQEVQASCERYEGQITDVQTQITAVKEKIALVRQKSAAVEGKRQLIASYETKVKLLKNKIDTMKANVTTEEQIEERTKKDVEQVLKKMVQNENEVLVQYKAFLEKIKKRKFEYVKLLLLRKEDDYLTRSYREKQRVVEKLEENLLNLQTHYDQIKTKEREGLEHAKALSNGVTRDDPGFDPFRPSYEELVGTIEQLDAQKEELQSRINCMRSANDSEMQEYERREQEIAELNIKIERGNRQLEQLTQLQTRCREEWLDPLQEIVSKINVKFGDAFARMGCAGEVTISTGADENDYAEYALSVKVSYRDGEPLQELNATVQSGGERAVATAAFMLALQELTPVPFRCVDEINQGMDAQNERRIFELLVESTSVPNTAQYFLITPKLVSGLKFVNTMKVHIVHNGPFLAPSEQWTRTMLCNPEEL